MLEPVGVGIVGARVGDQSLHVIAEPFVQEDVIGNRRAQLNDAFLLHQVAKAHLLEVEVHQLAFLFGRQVADVDHNYETIGRGFRERERALPELNRVHRRNGEAERRQVVGLFAHRDGSILEAFEERTLRLERNAVDLIEEDHLGRRQRSKLRHERPSGGVDHLKPDHLGRLEIRASL